MGNLYTIGFQSLLGGETSEALFTGYSFAEAEQKFYDKYVNFGILYISYSGTVE